MKQIEKHYCDECEYTAKTISAVRSHKKIKHMSTQQLDGNITLNGENTKHMKDMDSSETDSDLESEAEKVEIICFRDLTEYREVLIVLESTEKCQECEYKNADMAELIVHIVN